MAKAAQLRNQAKKSMIHEYFTLRFTNAQWVVWLDNHCDFSQECMHTRCSDRRRCNELVGPLEAAEGVTLGIGNFE